MLAHLKRTNPKQWQLVKDTAPFSVGICPRRAGKSYAGAMAALITGEAKPGAISIVISLNLKQLKRLYWQGGPSGLFTLARDFKLNLTYHHSMLRWEHENGSIGYLMGAEDEEQLEVLRGLEADLYLIDECKSFVPNRLRTLLVEIIGPQRNSRKGRIVMIGTPGFITAGPFWEASCPQAFDENKRPFSVPYGQKDPFGRDPRRIWSRHTWTLQDNSVMRHQWDEALLDKEKNGWSDDHPVWRREYLGEWTTSADGLVYTYVDARGLGIANWSPARTDDNPTGLPAEGAPWRLVGGLDLGFQAPTAFVIAAYSSKLGELRHVHDESHPHMLVDDVADMLRKASERFGVIEVIYADAGNLGTMVVQTLAQMGFPIEKAEKREKFDHIELLNSALARGEIKIIPSEIALADGWKSTLEEQLLTDAWDLEKGTREELARAGRLREDESIPNDTTDAFLYLYRGSLHRFRPPTPEKQPEYLSPEWIAARQKEELRKAREGYRKAADAKLGNNFRDAPHFIKRALAKRDRWEPVRISNPS
jgi:hypothetical protein